MPTDDRARRRRQTDPLVAGVSEGVAAGYRAVGYVLEGASESMRRMPGSGSPRAAAARQRTAKDSPASVANTTADLAVEFLDRVSDAIREVAGALAERESFGAAPERQTLELSGPRGHEAEEEFQFTNTGPSALTEVQFEATDLLGAAGRISADAVRFLDENGEQIGRRRNIARVGPGKTTTVTVAVEIPGEAPAGVYRGVIATRSAPPSARSAGEGGPEGAWALLELEVGATDLRTAIAPVERPRTS